MPSDLDYNAELVTAVKAHALANYDQGGWDYVVETFTDDEIWDVIAGAQDAAAAIRRMARRAGLLDERRRDVRSTEW